MERAEAWKSKAKCHGLDPNLFVPEERGGSLKRIYAICNGDLNTGPPCPVRSQCDAFAEENGLVGVFGGRMHSQRTRTTVEVAEVVVLVVQDARPKPSGPRRRRSG